MVHLVPVSGFVSDCIIFSIITLVKSVLGQVQIQRSHLLRDQSPLVAHIMHDIRIRNRYVVLSLWHFDIVYFHPMLSNPILILIMV